jgi:hypothetical protein
MGSNSEGRGRLFTQGLSLHPNSPHMRGEITIGGETYALAAWWNDCGHGPYLRIVAQPAEVRAAHVMLAGAARVDPSKIADVDAATFGIEMAE